VGDEEGNADPTRRRTAPSGNFFVTTKDDLEVEHFGADHGTVARDYIADWLRETFAGM